LDKYRQGAQEQIFQPIIINGQQQQGEMVILNGTVQTYTCTSPRRYVTLDQSSSGWACEQTTGMWLLHALPPQQNPSGYIPYGYYPYYSYYPYIIGPRVGIGFGLRSGIIVNRAIGINRAVGMARPVVPFVASRPFGGLRQPGGIGFGRIGHR